MLCSVLNVHMRVCVCINTSILLHCIVLLIICMPGTTWNQDSILLSTGLEASSCPEMQGKQIKQIKIEKATYKTE